MEGTIQTPEPSPPKQGFSILSLGIVGLLALLAGLGIGAHLGSQSQKDIDASLAILKEPVTIESPVLEAPVVEAPAVIAPAPETPGSDDPVN